MPNLTLNGTEFYDAPKNAGTTVRMWVKHYEGQLPDFTEMSGYYNLKGIGAPSLWRNNTVKAPQFFNPGAPGNVRWCIKRDPVERFISAYNDKIMREKLASWSVDACLSMLSSGEMMHIAQGTSEEKLLACHFLGQSVWFGSSLDYYDHIFDISRMDLAKAFCEEVVFGIKLPDLHARNQSSSGIEKVELTTAERTRAAAIFSEDYAAGWL